MLIKKPDTTIKSWEITDRKVYLRRREFMQSLAGSLAATTAPAWLAAPRDALGGEKIGPAHKSAYSTPEPQTPYQDITHYNNFYEFGTDKDSPAKEAHRLVTRPWTVQVDGEVKRPKVYDIDELLKISPLEERVYRLRCVEGWSMVIPWIGFPLNKIIRHAEPKGNAKYVEFTTLLRPEQMPGQRYRVLDWPYVEGLRLDEAMHPLTILALGLYGEVLPNQNGAPVRLVTPWKYGFKSIKSIVRMRFVERQPISSWMKAAPEEYGFYSNVNPQVDHPRWSQAKERRIGEFFKRDTLMFNGYADQVAKLYTGMDLKKNF